MFFPLVIFVDILSQVGLDETEQRFIDFSKPAPEPEIGNSTNLSLDAVVNPPEPTLQEWRRPEPGSCLDGLESFGDPTAIISHGNAPIGSKCYL